MGTHEGTLILKVIDGGDGHEDLDEVKIQANDPISHKACVIQVKRHEFSRLLAKPGTHITARILFAPLLVDSKKA